MVIEVSLLGYCCPTYEANLTGNYYVMHASTLSCAGYEIYDRSHSFLLRQPYIESEALSDK